MGKAWKFKKKGGGEKKRERKSERKWSERECIVNSIEK